MQVEDVGGRAGGLQDGNIHGWRFNRDISRFDQFQQVGTGLLVSLHDAEAQPVIVVCGNGNRILSQTAGNSFAAIVVMFGILTILVEVQVSVGIEHCALQLQVQRLRLAIHPLVYVEHGELVGAGVGGIVAVVGFFPFISFLFSSPGKKERNEAKKGKKKVTRGNLRAQCCILPLLKPLNLTGC